MSIQKAYDFHRRLPISYVLIVLNETRRQCLEGKLQSNQLNTVQVTFLTRNFLINPISSGAIDCLIKTSIFISIVYNNWFTCRKTMTYEPTFVRNLLSGIVTRSIPCATIVHSWWFSGLWSQTCSDLQGRDFYLSLLKSLVTYLNLFLKWFFPYIQKWPQVILHCSSFWGWKEGIRSFLNTSKILPG